MRFILTLILVAASSSAAKLKSLPHYLPICHRSTPDFDACVLRATESLRPQLARGIPELRLPALEPLLVPEVQLEQGTRAVNFNCTLTNLEIYGLSDFQIISEKADVVDKKQISGKLKIPNMRLVADYVIDGKVLLLPLVGKGKFNANFSEAIADVTLNGKIVNRRSTKFYDNSETLVKIQFNEAQIHFDNLFNGDKMLGPTTNRFLNENSREILNEITPVVETVTAHIIQDIATKVFSSFSYDQLFPE